MVAKSTPRALASDDDLERWLDALVHDRRRLETEAEVAALCGRLRATLAAEPNVRAVPRPVTVCGDVHGQFADVLKLLLIGGWPPGTSYLFLGDYVDRGAESVETIELLFCLQARWPAAVTLLRGNHECRSVTRVYGFYDECVAKYGSARAWRDCCDVFDYLAVAAVVDRAVFCVHGGLSPEVETVGDLELVRRVGELPTEGALCDVLWSDPADDQGDDDWLVSTRGAGFVFGARVVDEFLHRNRLDLVARAHQLVMEGHKFHFVGETLVTVWSAPNYCGRCGNLASIMRLTEGAPHLSFITFDTAVKPAPDEDQQPPEDIDDLFS